MKKYAFKLIGETPLLMHADDVDAADRLMEWRKDPANKDKSKAGDDRSPAWTWKTYVYSDTKRIVMPADNLMTCLRDAGAQIKIKGNKTYKSLTQSGIIVDTFAMPLLVNDKEIPIKQIEAITSDEFDDHVAAADALGFELFVKRAVIGQSKHVRVRPRFDDWAFEGTLTVTCPEDLKTPILKQIFDIAGSTKGLGDWRPSSPRKPGQFGRFKATLTECK